MFFRPSRIVPALVCCGALLASGAPGALAGSDTGEITISVVDSGTSLALASARTILLGPQTASSLTTAAGVIRYTDVPVGIYRVRVTLRGYDASSSAEFEVLPNRAVAVRVALALASGGLKTIGSVTARSSVTIASTDVDADSPIRRLSDSLTDALDKVAGVSVTQDTSDPRSAVTVSLNGHDESQTAVSLDGIPLAAPGGTANLRAIGTDLFSGSSTNHAPGAGSLGGGINFRTLQPTQSLQIRANGTTGTFDRSNYQFAATGSVGRFGFAAQHTWRGANSPLTFQVFRDQSGLTYPHEGESHGLGDFFKFRYRLRDERTTFGGAAFANNTDSHALCARDVTLLPCGIGPNNQNYGRFGFAYATLQSLVGNVTTTLTAYEHSGVQNTDDVNRFVLLPDLGPSVDGSCGARGGSALVTSYSAQRCPSLGTSTTFQRGFTYAASIASGKHTFAATGTTSSSTNASRPTAGSRFEKTFTNAVASSSYQLSDSYKVDDRLSLTPRLSLANTTALGTSLLGGIAASWRPRTADTFGASINVGSSQPNVNLNRSFSDPVSARFDCGAGTALVNGPGDDTGGAQSAVSFDATWTHQFVRSGAQFSLDAFSQVQSGQIVNATIAEPVTYFPTTYLTTLANVFAAPSVCGSAPPPTVYVNEPVGGTRRVYQGVTASARFALGRYVVVLPNYTLNVATLTAASPRLADGPSTTIVGRQLPGRPVHRAGATLDGLLPRSGTELLLNAQYTGANNQQNLGPFVTFAAGIAHAFGPGRVTLFENNVFNTYGGSFATDANAQPLALTGDRILRTAATPLTPRTINLGYAINLGGARPTGARTARPSAGAGVDGRAAGAGNRFVPVPPPPGVDVLSLAVARTSCDAAAQVVAKPLFEGLRAYVGAYEAKTVLPEVPDMEIVAHPLSLDPAVPYYLELRPRGPAAPSGPRPLRVFAGCAYVTAYAAAEARTRGIATASGRPGLFYLPTIGLIYVRSPELPQGGGSLKGAQ
ncbi:MAG: hypothetical protein NVSMB19_11530 [Vulcanimicrobiaceae bacterium]